MKILTILKWLAVILFTLAGLAPLTFVAINWADEKLSPEGEALLRAPESKVADAANGYYVLLGMNAPADANALETGRKIQAARDRLYREDPLRQNFDAPDLLPAVGTSPELGFDKLRCPMQGNNCVNRYLAQAPLVREQMRVHALSLARYGQMMQLPGYEEKPIPSPYAPLANYQAVTRAAELELAGAVLDVDAGRDAAGLAKIAAGIAYHRQLLAGSSGLLTRMISVSMLRRELQVLSELIERKPALAQSQRKLFQRLLAPLTPQENDLRPAIAVEARSLATMLQLMPEMMKRQGGGKPGFMGGLSETWAARFIYLPNASINRLTPYWSAIAGLGHGSAATYEQRKQQFAQSPTGQRKWSGGVEWNYVRNPMGKILAGIALPEMGTYIERVHDLDGYIRLVSLQVAIRAEQVAPAAIGEFADKAVPEMCDPYTGMPMGWDAASSSLWFVGHQRAPSNPVAEPKTYRVRLAAV